MRQTDRKTDNEADRQRVTDRKTESDRSTMRPE